jgi:aspartyl/glutamyl-tRNA(Asn/Gln) amidotransferase C subunit
MQGITEEALLRLAARAQLSLGEGEAERFAAELDEMLLMLADLNGVAPCKGGADALTTASLRADTVGASLSRKDALANAPVQDGEYIAVPRVLE